MKRTLLLLLLLLIGNNVSLAWVTTRIPHSPPPTRAFPCDRRRLTTENVALHGSMVFPLHSGHRHHQQTRLFAVGRNHRHDQKQQPPPHHLGGGNNNNKNKDQIYRQWNEAWSSFHVAVMIATLSTFGLVANAGGAEPFAASSSTTSSQHAVVVSTSTASPSSSLSSSSLSSSSSSSSSSPSSSLPVGKRYWSIITLGTPQERAAANEALVDYAVGTINTMLYDNSGGAYFQPSEFYERWRHLKEVTRTRTISSSSSNKHNNNHNHHSIHHTSRDTVPVGITMETREGVVEGLKWLVSTIGDPFSKYLTREELLNELKLQNDGFLGFGAMVESPQDSINRFSFRSTTVAVMLPNFEDNHASLLSGTRVANLPVVTAVAPDSPAERCGIVVGDRIVAVGQDNFLGRTHTDVARALKARYSAENYLGVAEITIAKPVIRSLTDNHDREVVIGYRSARVKVPTRSVYPYIPYSAQGLASGGDDMVHFELLTSSDSILDQSKSKVGYIRLTRFSRAATAGYVRAIEVLEAAGAQSYIVDVRNNYGGVIQEAMLTASTLLRDPHAVLCYTMNSRGGFTPHEAEEYIVDTRYPGYFLSSEPKSATLTQVKRERPDIFTDHGIEWSPPSSFASIHEHTMRRGHSMAVAAPGVHWITSDQFANRLSLLAQKKLVVLINEGTASAAEVFASALHDNGRTVALVGTKTYGKGLIQHTFPLPDGGGLRLTVAEYLTPTLHHVTNVGSARFDQSTGEWIGGGIRPDVYCESKQGIPGKIGADFCVGMALDALEDAEAQEAESSARTGQPLLRRVGGSQDGSGTRRPITAGVVRDDF